MSPLALVPCSLCRQWQAIRGHLRFCTVAASRGFKLLWVLMLRVGGPPALLIMLTLPVYGKCGEVFGVLPRVAGLPLAGKVAIGLLDTWLLAAGLYCTARAAFCDPGFAVEWAGDFEEPMLAKVGQAEQRRTWCAELCELCEEVLTAHPRREGPREEEHFPARCERCCRQRWPRTHHCSVCRRCVQRMDHHCLLINNCVGARNYRHFLLAVFYLWAGCLLFLLLSICAEAPSGPTRGVAAEETLVHNAGGSGISVWAALRGAFTQLSDACDIPPGLRDLQFQTELCWRSALLCYALTTYLLLEHGRLVLTNETSIEAAAKSRPCKEGRGPKSFDLGWRQNFQEVFGPCNPWRLHWLVPFRVLPPLGDHMATA